MAFRLVVLVLSVSGVVMLGLSGAQFEGVVGISGSIDSGALLENLFEIDESIAVLELPTMAEYGQTMTGVDSDTIMASSLEYSGADIVLLSGDNDSISSSGSTSGELYSGVVDPGTGQILSDIIPHVIVSEVYYDGTDEWIEITNISEGNFQGNIILSGAKSTPVSLTDIFLLSGESKLFGDTLTQISGNVSIGKTGLALSMTDTAAVRIHLLISGQIEDSFLVDQYRVNKYNDKKTSFERVAEVPTRVQTNRITHAQLGYSINPGTYFTTGVISNNVSLPPAQSGANLQIPIACDSLDQRDLIKINEIFPGNEKYPPYIELSIHENISLDSLSISGNILGTGIEFSFVSGAMNLENNTLLILATTGFWQSEGIDSVRNSDFSLLSTGNRLLITIGSGQNRRVMDIVYVSGYTLGSSSYFGSTSQECVRIMDVLDVFSPGFQQKFLKYMVGTTITKIEYIQTGNIPSSGTGSCQVPGLVVPFSGDMLVSTDISTIENEYSIHILAVEYDPEGSDTNKEKITLLASHASGDQSPLDLGKLFRLKVNGRNKTLSGMLAMNVPTTFIKTFGFPNSTDSGQSVTVSLTYGDYIFDTYTYNPQKLSTEDEQALTNTGYMVSSVIDGDTMRIKYQGKTQSIRLLGIDAPESTKTRYKYLECFGTEAKNYLKSLVDKKKITFQFDPAQDQKDIYDRLLAYVFLNDELINQTMIEDGYAKEYTYKTTYTYQSQFKQAEELAQEQGMGLWNTSACGVSLSGIVLTGETESTGALATISGLQFTISYVLPNPKGSDKAEELGLRIDYETGSSAENKIPNDSLDLSQGFSLRIGKTKKKIEGVVTIGQENILSGSLGLVNKAACVSLFYQEQELVRFCYGKPKEGQKIYASDQGLAETPQENLDILNILQLKRIGNQLCIWYKEQSFLCKRIPASKAEIKATQEQKLYKGFASLIKQYIITNWKNLYYDTQLKEYFDLVAQNKKLIAGGKSHVDIYGQSLLVTDLKGQLQVLQTTLPGIIALFIGEKGLRE